MKKFTLFLMLAAMCMPQFVNAQEKQDPPLWFTTEDIEVYIGYTLDASQFLYNPENLPITWHSSDESVFTVDENGVITSIAPNMVSAWVEVSFAGNDEYWNTIAGMEPGARVWVKDEYPLSIGEYKVTPDDAASFWGGNMSFDPVTSTLTMTNVELNGVDIKWDHISPLTINLIGENKAVNGSLDAQKLILTGGGSFEQNYVLYADSLVIDSASLSVEVAFNTNSSMDYTFSINKLSIINHGHFYACISANEDNILGEYDHVGFVNEELHFGEGIDYIVSYYPPVWVRDALSEENVMSVWKRDMFNNAFFWNIEETYILLRGALEIGYVGAPVHVLPDYEPTELTFDDMSANAGLMAVNLGANDELTEGEDGNVYLKTPVTIPDEAIDTILANYTPDEAVYQNNLPGITVKLPEGRGTMELDINIDPGWVLWCREPGENLFNIDYVVGYRCWFSNLQYYNLHESLAHFFVRPASSGAPVRKAVMDELMTGVTIWAIKVIPAENSGSGVEGIEASDRLNGAQKILRDGQLLIERDGKMYHVTGARVR